MRAVSDDAVERSSPRRRSVGVGWLLLAAGVISAVVLSALPAPYAIERPGPVFDTLGAAPTSDGGRQRLITVTDARTYPTSGALDLLTVNLVGSREDPVTWSGVAAAWFDPSQAIVPIDLIYPDGLTQRESDRQGAAEMTTSKQEAVAAALRQLGYTVTGTVVVAQVLKDSPAAGRLRTGDRILSADGTALQDATALRSFIADSGTATPIAFGILRGGAEQTVTVTPRSGDDGTGRKVPLIGIVPGARYDYPVEVKIRLDDVGGPSAGMMFALGIIDTLTPGKLTGGQRIAGTGEIDAAGRVGAIGGIRQKMYGARRAGADWFLAPASNCGEVAGRIPDGLRVFSVSTLTQAVAAVTAIGSGTGLDQLPTCTQK
ncbi:MAG: PDZ domain-containing protein [Micrococcales bacterium]|nr:PDZ domain-containing protein [Micrococcales bacterium]